MDWQRTGKITMRSGEYLIIKYPTHYLALRGPQTQRETIGRFKSAEDAKQACEMFDNVEFSGGAPLHGAASAGTQGYATED
jgi:hypothetical protein